MNKSISEIMSTDIFTLSGNDTLQTAAQIMKEQDTGFIPVMENERVIGVVTDRDLVVRGYFNGCNADTKVKSVMTDNCIIVSKDTSIEEAARLMAKNKVRRLCVLDNGKLAGVCAIGDISVSQDCIGEAGIALSKISRQNNSSYING